MTALTLFFTWDVSLSLWKEKGLLQREIKLYQKLAASGVEVTFLTWGGEEEDAIAAELPEFKVVPIYKHVPRPKSMALRALCSLLVPFKLKAQLQNTDILKTNQMWGGWVAALSSMIWRKPLIARSGYELYQFTVKQGHGFFRRAFVWLISWITYMAASRIVVATQDDKDFVIKHFKISPDKIQLQPNWIDTDKFCPRSIEQKQGHVLFVGRLNEQKNLYELIDAIAATGYTLDLVGDGELRTALSMRAKETGAKVNFLGFQPNDTLPEIYNSYLVYVLCSHYEGNPKTMLEAMSCARAVLATDVPGIASVIEHEKNGILCQKNGSSIAEGLRRLMDDETLRGQLGQAARQQIIDTQTLDKQVERELACYKAIMENVKS